MGAWSAGQQRVVQRFTDACRDDDDVAAAFLGGSHASGSADVYADLDLYLITTDQGYDRFFARRREFLRSLGDPVFSEDFSGFGFDMLLFLMADGVDGELAFARASKFTHVHGGPVRVLVDKGGLLRGVEFPLYRPDEHVQLRALRELLVMFWREAWHVGKAMTRKRLWSAQGGLERMRRMVVNLMRLHADFSALPEGYSKVEHLLAPADLEELAETLVPLDPALMWRAAHRLVELHRRVGTELARRHSVQYPVDVDRVVSSRLGELAGSGGSC